jgi:hypothetical protein
VAVNTFQWSGASFDPAEQVVEEASNHNVETSGT